MKLQTVTVQVGVAPFVWHKGKVWAVHHTTLDYRDCLSLVSLKDSSLGILAPVEECHNCDSRTIEACYARPA